MKTRVCFVGFENESDGSLESWKHALAAAGGWDSVFLPNGEETLLAMRSAVFDVMVTEMHLPGINGAELLHKAAELQPKMLRFVLGDVGDQESIVNGIGNTHQFIGRPCAPQKLISTIQRSLALDVWLSTKELHVLLRRLKRLPSLPSTYFEMLKQVESPHATAQSIGEVISRDPVVTARLLQMVNSAAFALDQKITDPVDAVCLLGFDTVKSLVLCLQVFSDKDDAKNSGISFSRMWTHSFDVAILASRIALQETEDSRMSNEAFTAGLLHDLGRIVMASNFPEDYAAAVENSRQTSRPLYEVEVERFGVTHAQVSGYLLGLWGMPAPLVEAAALHHIPNHAPTREFSLLTAVHVADVLVHEREQAIEHLPLPRLDTIHLTSLGLQDRVDAWRRGETTRPTGKKSEPVSPAKQTAKAARQPVPAGRNPVLTGAMAAACVLALGLVLLLVKNLISPQDDLKVQARTPEAQPALPVPSAPESSGSPALESRSIAAPPRDNASEASATTAGAVPSESASNVTAVSEPSASASVPTAAAPAVKASPFETVKVQGIFYGHGDPSAMINGKTLRRGDRINGVEIIAIGPGRVTLGYGAERKTVVLK